ncbi:hypothetical protein D3C86_2215780 [compost metagenome]
MTAGQQDESLGCKQVDCGMRDYFPGGNLLNSDRGDLVECEPECLRLLKTEPRQMLG